MSYLDNYRRRLHYKNSREAVLARTKQAAHNSFFDSPTLTEVIYNGEIRPVIRSDRYKDIELQLFLFEPETEVKIGALLEVDGYTYLAFQKNGESIYPELHAKICNDFFEVPMGHVEEEYRDRFGNIKHRKEPILVTVPASIQDKDYSTASNSIIPLPAGRINIEIPYKEEYLTHFRVNHTFDHSAGKYQVTDIREARSTPDPDERYIKISAQRIASDGEVAFDE